MAVLTNLGIANSYIAKITNIENDLTISGSAKLEGGLVAGYQATASTSPTISSGTLALYCIGGTTANCTVLSPVAGRTLFIGNCNSGTLTIGSVSLTTNFGGMIVYDGSAWTKIVCITIN